MKLLVNFMLCQPARILQFFSAHQTVRSLQTHSTYPIISSLLALLLAKHSNNERKKKNGNNYIAIDKINFIYHGIAVKCWTNIQSNNNKLLAKCAIHDTIAGPFGPVGCIFLRQYGEPDKGNGCILRDCRNVNVHRPVLVFGVAKTGIESFGGSITKFSGPKYYLHKFRRKSFHSIQNFKCTCRRKQSIISCL